jgi:NAD(P)-dependent dehydrogenase (short-subunit alcohol dehydrogenase family)
VFRHRASADTRKGIAMNAQHAIVITGANRGMGLEFARQYAAAGWRVYATARKPQAAEALQTLAREQDSVSVHALDVADSDSVRDFAAALGGEAVDVLLSNASHMMHLSQQSFEEGDADGFAASFEVNAIGPFRMAQALIDNVRASALKKMVFMGSTAGSTGSILPPVKLFAYCPAKAALHSVVRGLHLNLAPEGIAVGLLEPGVVDTQGFAQVQPGEPAPYGMDVVVDLLRKGAIDMATPAAAVEALRQRIEELTPENGGQLTRFDGEIIPW